METAMSTESNASANLADEQAAGAWRDKLLGVCWRIAVPIVVLAAVASTLVTVDESEYVLVERFGEIVAVYDRPEDRGLHFKLPWPVDLVRRFDRREQIFDPPGREVLTGGDNKNIVVDTYVCWRIAPADGETAAATDERPVVRFFRSLGSLDIAEARINTYVQPVVSTLIGQHDLDDLFGVADPEEGPRRDRSAALARLSEEARDEVRRRIAEAAGDAGAWGIEIIDVRIKRINFPEGNRQAVYERMVSERNTKAVVYRKSGEAESAKIRSRADRQYEELLARAKADAERIRGEAEAAAINILNRAHAEDPDFYRVWVTLETYRQILNERTTLVLSASSELLKLLTEGVPELPAPPPPPTTGAAGGPAVPTGETRGVRAVETPGTNGAADAGDAGGNGDSAPQDRSATAGGAPETESRGTEDGR